MTSAIQFPCVLPIWRPPLPTSALWKNKTIAIGGAFEPNDMLVAVALALCQQGSPHAQFYIVLPHGSVQVVFPSNNNLSLQCWRPQLVHTSTHALVALKLNHNLSSRELVELAVSLSVPFLISQHSGVSTTDIQATYDNTAVKQSQAGWFLIHLSNALRCLRTHRSHGLQSNMLLIGAMERFLFSDNVLTRHIPPSLLFLSANALRSWPVQCNQYKISDVPLVSASERILLSGHVAPQQQPFWDKQPHESLLHDIFLERARVDPLSIVFRSHHITEATAPIVEVSYASCYTMALCLALKLLSAGVQAHSVVPIILVHPVDIAISMIAVLLAGSAYAIMDPQVSDVAALQKCLRLGRFPSPVVLIDYALHHSRFRCLPVDPIDPRVVNQNSLQDPWECHSPVTLPSVVGGDIAFVTSSSHQWDASVVTYATHTDATDFLRMSFESLQITATSKVLITNNSPSGLLQQTIWNVLSHGGTVCSVADFDLDVPFLQALYNLRCTHVALPASHLSHLSLALSESPSIPDSSVCDDACALPLHTLIVPDDPPAQSMESISQRGIKIIKYNHDDSFLEKKPDTTDVENLDIEIIFRSESDAVISPVEVLTLLPSGLVLHSMDTKVIKIRDDLVVKYGSCVLTTEACNMTFVREHTSILVPRVHLVFRQNHCLYITMQYIDGCTLERQWDTLDECTRADMLSQLTEYLRQLRTLKSTSSTPGPVDKTACRGQWFTIYNAGPFHTHSELVEWLNHKVDISDGAGAEAFSENYRLVFTHQDLAPRNFILDKTNKLWIIDWEFAGWYPAYFEYACVASLLHPIPDDWINQVLPCLGSYEREYRSLQAITWALEFTPFA